MANRRVISSAAWTIGEAAGVVPDGRSPMSSILNSTPFDRAAGEAARSNGVEFRMELMGERPSGTTPAASPIVQAALEITRRFAINPQLDVGSTDANVPIAMGIPAIAVGGGGSAGNVHTPEEWFDPLRRELGVQRLLAMTAVLA